MPAAVPVAMPAAVPWRRRAAVGLAVLLGAALGLAGLALALDRAFPPDLRRLTAVGRVVRDHDGRVLALLPAPGGVRRLAAGPGDVAPGLVRLLIATEDRRFYLHPGVDPLAILRAVAQAAWHGRIVSGGSTLAMQAARLLHPQPRTLRAKIEEAARALQLEWRYGRAGVLRIWLTLAPEGGSLEGVRAAAYAWFGHGPERLEPAEAALLVAIPRRPEGLRPDRHAAAAYALRGRVLRLGVREGLFDVAAAPPVPTVRQAMPDHAPQLVRALAATAPPGPLTTTLDLPLQTAVERLVASRLAGLPPRVSAAVLVVDAAAGAADGAADGAAAGAVRAVYAGDWGDAARAGSMDLTRAVRSPGSALKPFIYGLAFADGIAGPATPLQDLPAQYGAYAPENYDRGFAGGVTAADALRQSLNLPAVWLLDRVGPLRYVTALRAAGITVRLPGGAPPSLPLALGGFGISLRDAAALYGALATDGAVRPLRFLAGAPLPAPRPLLPAPAARAVAATLWRRTPGAASVRCAWKTGTSWGGRDAWALGVDARHVVAVWIGRPDGTPVAAATGATLALPLLSQVFELLPPAPFAADAVAAALADTPPPATPLGSAALRLLFPPPGAVLSADDTVTIRVMGGRRPLTFMVDGTPIDAAPARREAAWLPPGPGFYRLTVLDARGAAVHAGIRVR